MVEAADGVEALAACRERAAGVGFASHGQLDRPGIMDSELLPGTGEGRSGRRSSRIGVITMDKSMPVMDGIEATRAIRAEFGDAFVIVGLTGDALGADLESFKAAGLDDVLGKPASAGTVYAVLRRCLS